MYKLVSFTLLILFARVADGQVLISLLFGDKLNSGQIEFGLDGGLSLSDLAGLEESKWHRDFNLGFYFDIKTKKPDWLFNTGVRVKSTTGADEIPVYPLQDADLDSVFAGGSITRKMQCFYVPIDLKYKFKNQLYVQGGIQLGLMYKAVDVFRNEVEEKDDLSYKLDIRDQYHPLDAGLLAGVGYRIEEGNGWNLGLQYYHGLVDARVSDNSPNEFNRVFYLNIGIPIGKGKAQAQAAEQSQE